MDERPQQLARSPRHVLGDRSAREALGLPRAHYDVPVHFRPQLHREQPADRPVPQPVMDEWMTGPQAPPDDATVGKRILVNGQFAPYLRVRPGRYRLRLLNASLFSAYDFALSSGRPFVQVGTGSGLLPHTVVRQDVLLGPAQRANVVVDFRDQEGQNIVLSTIPRSDGSVGTGSRAAALMQFRVRGHSDQRSRVPDRLRPIPKHRRACEGRQDLDLRPDQGPRTAPTGRSTARCSTLSGWTTGCGWVRSSGGGSATPAT